MIRKIIVLRSTIVLLLTLLTNTASFGKQMREVVIDTICRAPISKMLQVVDSFYYQFQACPDSLFKWAYLGLEEEKNVEAERTKESRDVFHLQYKDRTYDKKEKVGDVAIDIYVLGIRWWKDQHLVTRYLFTPPHPRHSMEAHLTANYSGSIIEAGDFIILLDSVSTNMTKVHYEFRITFGRILSAFISNKTWTNAIEWRFVTMLENLVECAETGTVLPKKRGPNTNKKSK